MTRWIAKHPWWATIALIIAADAAILGSASAADAHGEGHTPVTFCHNGHEITTDDDGLINGHYQHIEQGKDTLGPCPPSITPTPSPTATETPSPTPTTEVPTPTPTPLYQHAIAYWNTISEYKPDRHSTREQRVTDLGRDLSAFFEPHHYGTDEWVQYDTNWPWASRDGNEYGAGSEPDR
jgi:hypothetical protein